MLLSIATVAVMALTACTPNPQIVPQTPRPTATPVGTPNPDVDWAIDQALSALAASPRDDLSHVVIPATRERDLLSRRQQAIYDDIGRKVEAVQPGTYKLTSAEVEGEGKRPLNLAYAFHQDHLELASYADLDYVTGWFGGKDKGKELYVLRYWRPSEFRQYTDDLEKVRADVIPLLAMAKRIVERMPQDMSTYDKYRYLAYVESLITDYDDKDPSVTGDPAGVTNPLSETVWGALGERRAVCGGYSITYAFLCHLAGLWAETVVGRVSGYLTSNHEWNLVQLDSGTYYVDVTWADGNGTEIGGPEWMRYFMMDEATASLDHKADHVTATGSAAAVR